MSIAYLPVIAISSPLMTVIRNPIAAISAMIANRSLLLIMIVIPNLIMIDLITITGIMLTGIPCLIIMTNASTINANAIANPPRMTAPATLTGATVIAEIANQRSPSREPCLRQYELLLRRRTDFSIIPCAKSLLSTCMQRRIASQQRKMNMLPKRESLKSDAAAKTRWCKSYMQ